jgi:hypothetical protein
MSISAMKEALEALENTYAYLPRRWGGEREADQAITALRQAIAEAEQPDLARVGEVGVWGDKREWVGLATGEAREFYESDLSREELIHKIDEFLQEKNT